MIDSTSCCMSEECKRLYDNGARINDVKTCTKSKKKADNKKLKRIIYHLQDKDEVEMAGIKKNLLDLEN